jgi:hypothetical protein
MAWAWSPRIESRGEALQGLEIELAQPLPLREEPLVVVSLEEIGRVQIGGFSQRGEAAALVGFLVRTPERPLEGCDVEPEGRVFSPTERAWRHLE